MTNFKPYLLITLCVLTTIRVSAYNRDPDYRKARVKGAQTLIELKVTDGEGMPVAHANVHVLMGMNHRVKSYDIDGVTDTNGVFLICGKTTGNEIEISVSKIGHYLSQRKLSFISMGHEYKVVDGKWQPWGMRVPLVLRKIRKQAKLLFFTSPSREIPFTNTWIGVDLKCNDLVKPYGHGTVSDVVVKLDWDGRSLGDSNYCAVELAFPNPHDGGYFSSVVDESRFKYVYCAETNRIDVRKLRIPWERDKDYRNLSNPQTKEASELVVRVRTQVDEKGNVLSAYYGSIVCIYVSPRWCGNPTIRFVHVLNPTSNDTNLEYHE